MPDFSPRTRAKKGEELTEPLQGELALYEKVGLFTKPLSERTAYRYRGVLLQYQKTLKGNPPSLQASIQFLAKLRQDGFKPSTLRLMSDAGLRREEVVSLQIRNIDLTDRFVRVRGKGDKDRVVPLTKELHKALDKLCKDRSPVEYVIGIKGKAVWNIVKKYAAMAGKPDLHPHDLRHAFATRLVEGKANIRAIRELLGHEDLITTAVYLGISPKHLQEAIDLLDKNSEKYLDVVVQDELGPGDHQKLTPPDYEQVKQLDRKSFIISDRILNETRLRGFLADLRLNHNYRISEYAEMLRFYNYFSLEVNKYIDPSLRKSCDKMWKSLDALVWFLKLQFEQKAESKKEDDPTFILSP
ncbi:tyrosine-type recombinase/integrase, partial [Chloroflexota bacterium]